MPQLTQQQQLVLRWFLLVITSGGASAGLIPKAWAEWLASDATFTVLCSLGAFALLVMGWLKTRPTTVVADAGNIVAKDGGAIIASKAMADSKRTPDNVVASVSEAAALPGVKT
jgi:hypothetical protein